MDAQDIVDGVVSFLAALTRLLVSSLVGADDAPLPPVMGTRGEAGAVAGGVATGVASSACGVTTVAASASATPRRWARADRERAGLELSEPHTSHGSCLLSLSRDIRGVSYQKESGRNAMAPLQQGRQQSPQAQHRVATPVGLWRACQAWCTAPCP